MDIFRAPLVYCRPRVEKCVVAHYVKQVWSHRDCVRKMRVERSELKLGSQNTSDTNCNVYFERVSYPFFLLMNSHEPRTYCRAIEELIYLTLKSISDGRHLSESDGGIVIIYIMFIAKGYTLC